MIAAPGITVNGVKISIEQINAEVQYHPASSFFDAKYAAMLALVIRELLVQRAVTLGICASRDVTCSVDDVVSQVLQQEIGRVGVVGVDAPDPRRREEYVLGPLALEKRHRGGLVGEVELGVGAHNEVAVALLL